MITIIHHDQLTVRKVQAGIKYYVPIGMQVEKILALPTDWSLTLRLGKSGSRRGVAADFWVTAPCSVPSIEEARIGSRIVASYANVFMWKSWDAKSIAARLSEQFPVTGIRD